MSTAAKSRINIEVTEADIERAHKNDSYNCVVAQAVARTVPDATRIDVDTQTIRFTREATGDRMIYLTPYAVQGYVIAFDAGEAIEPFSFQLRDPIKARRKIRTDAGRRVLKAAAQARRQASKAQTTEVSTESDKAPVETSVVEPREAAKAAYAQARALEQDAPLTTASPGRQAPPRVWKKKQRSYGHRVLRINQDA